MRTATLAMMLLLTDTSPLSIVRADHSGAGPLVLQAEDYGVLGDGLTDDGPAIANLMDAAEATKGPLTVAFPSNRTFYVHTVPERYVFDLEQRTSLTLEGGGSTFLLDPHLRFLRLADSKDIVIRNLNVDFAPLPFADGIVAAVNAEQRYLDVRLLSGVPVPSTGGTIVEPHDQAFFAMLWHDGAHGSLSRHYWTELVEPGPEPGTVRVHAGSHSGTAFNAFGNIKPEEWRISVPVPGIAHRYGPGPCFQIRDNDSLTMEDVELWSAPWFGFGITRNRGTLVFRRVHIRPKPGTNRLMSIWRDGFHVKGNSASMLWEDCVLSGMNDDAFNISTHSSAVSKVHSPTRIEVYQKFPLNPMPWHEAATLTAADATAQRLLGTANILNVEVGPDRPPIEGHAAAPRNTLDLDRPIPGLKMGTMVWDPATSNPDTTLRGCRIEMSCRMQSPVVMERCDVTALMWFYGEGVEGAFPHHVVLRNNKFRRGRGNPTLALSFSGAPKREASAPDAGAPPRAIHDIVIENNDIWGVLSAHGVENLRLAHNRFHESEYGLHLSRNHNVEDTDNRNVSINSAAATVASERHSESSFCTHHPP